MSRPNYLRRFAAAALVGSIASLSSVAGASAKPVTPTPVPPEPVSPQTLIAERTNPAVQLIRTSYTATLSARPTDYSSAGIDLLNRGVAKLNTGELRSASDVIAYVFEHIEQNPTYYLREFGEPKMKKKEAVGGGSGFAVAPNGYVVTAKHVVTSDTELIKDFGEYGAEMFARDETKSWIRFYNKVDLSNEAKFYINAAVLAFYKKKLKVHVATPEVSVVLGTASADGSRVRKEFPADIVYRSGSALGEDVAVLRIQVDGQLPSLALAPTPAVQGDTMWIVGFPDLPDDSEAAELQPTVTEGRITAIKPNRAGLQELQHNATASAGASGAPAVKGAGEVIGMLVSRAVDGEGGSLGQGYLMPLDSIRGALARSGAEPNPGQTTTLYNEALKNFYAGHYSVALPQFRQVKELFPAHAYVGGYISRAQMAISQGKDVPVVPPRKPVPWTLIVIVGGAAVLALGSAALGYGLSRRSRRNSSRAGLEGLADPQPVEPDASAAEHSDEGLAQMGHFDGSGSESTFSSAHADDEADITGLEDIDDIPEWEPIDYIEGYPENRPATPPN